MLIKDLDPQYPVSVEDHMFCYYKELGIQNHVFVYSCGAVDSVSGMAVVNSHNYVIDCDTAVDQLKVFAEDMPCFPGIKPAAMINNDELYIGYTFSAIPDIENFDLDDLISLTEPILASVARAGLPVD